jgi:hypothetical protein
MIIDPVTLPLTSLADAVAVKEYGIGEFPGDQTKF